MLVITRKSGEAVRLFLPAGVKAADVDIKVLGIYGNDVRIGIEAPLEVKVLRGEVWQRDQAARGGAR